MNRSIALAVSLALMSAPAWAEDKAASEQPDQAQSQDQSAAQDAGTASDASAATASEDQAQPAAGRQSGQQQDPTQMFIKDMYSHNLYEIQLSQMAEKQAQDPQIKQLAQMLIKDHTQANQQLKQVAQSAGVQVEEKLDAVHQAKLQKHQQCPKEEFGRKYANDQVAGHTMAVLELTYQAKNAKDQKVQQFAQQMLPKMNQHLKHATQVATTLAGGMAGGEARQASERLPADGASPSSDSPDQSGQDAAGQSQTEAQPDAASGPDAASKDAGQQ